MSTHAAVALAIHKGHPCPEQVEAVLHDTWGHLKPKVREIYSGHVIIAKSMFSGHGTIPLTCELKTAAGEGLDSSPWFYQDLNDFAYEQVKDRNDAGGWGLWKWEGTFERLKNGKSRWRGKTRPLRVDYRFGGRK